MARQHTIHNPNLLVLGAGVVGLSTAIRCFETWPGARVTIMADKFGPETTTFGAGGIFRPTRSKSPDTPLETLRKWLRDSWQYYDSLAHSPEASLAGTQIVSGYQFFNNVQENALEKEFVYQYRPLTKKEMRMFPGTQEASHGFFVTTLMTEGDIYLEYLFQKFKRNGGKCTRHKVKSMKELVGSYDVVFNCTGLGSRQLLGDNELVPIRGQLLKVKAPWIKHTVLYGDDQLCFVYPGKEYCIVGCTRQHGDDDLRIRERDTSTIWRDACNILPSLKRAEIVSTWVGLRPYRPVLRVEKEILHYGHHSLKMVHNYGHGAEGISLSWGTAVHAVSLAEEFLQQSNILQSKL